MKLESSLVSLFDHLNIQIVNHVCSEQLKSQQTFPAKISVNS